MLRVDLINLINQRGTWAFIGSGLSVDSGGPTWKRLVEQTAQSLPADLQKKIKSDRIYLSKFAKGDYAGCFSRIEKFATRAMVESGVVSQINHLTEPGALIQFVADWPFDGYITTNYDLLLEKSLQRINSQSGWITVGNSADEIRKVSGDARGIVWHAHGAAGLTQSKSRLVISEADYDEFYLDPSILVQQLRGLLSQRRVVFIGFGFQDPEVLRLLKTIGKLTSPARPIYAFLGGVSGNDCEDERMDLLERYNVDVIPYEIIDGSHNQLKDLLEVYGSMILRRSLRLNQPELKCPSYDPETTGLLVYNELCLKGGAQVSEDILGTLLRSRVLALLKHVGVITKESVILNRNL
jgi:hypothetical protein